MFVNLTRHSHLPQIQLDISRFSTERNNSEQAKEQKKAAANAPGYRTDSERADATGAASYASCHLILGVYRITYLLIHIYTDLSLRPPTASLPRPFKIGPFSRHSLKVITISGNIMSSCIRFEELMLIVFAIFLQIPRCRSPDSIVSLPSIRDPYILHTCLYLWRTEISYPTPKHYYYCIQYPTPTCRAVQYLVPIRDLCTHTYLPICPSSCDERMLQIPSFWCSLYYLHNTYPIIPHLALHRHWHCIKYLHTYIRY